MLRQVTDADAAAALAATVLNPDRDRPIVAVSTRTGCREPEFDPVAFAEDVGDAADVYLVQTGEPTWELAERLPDRFEVYGGALRIWWPGATAASDPYDHPLFLIFDERAVHEQPRRVLEALGRPVPAQAALRPGDVVSGIVSRIEPYGALVDVGGRHGLVHISEFPPQPVADPHEFVADGDEVRARVLQSDSRLSLSFREPEEERVQALESEVARLKAEIRELAEERRGLLAERVRLRERVRQLEQRRPEQRRGVRVDSEAEFRELVTREYESRYQGSDRERWPLRRYVLNERFLESLLALEGVSVERVAEVCAHVVAGRAHEIDGLAVHHLSRGRGTEQLVRGRDGAKAWRCALQRESASARRLHWWELPGEGVELASVGVHDKTPIPE